MSDEEKEWIVEDCRMFLACGRLTLAEWVALSDQKKLAMFEAASQIRMELAGMIGMASKDWTTAVILTGDIEAIEKERSRLAIEAYDKTKTGGK